MSSYTQGRNVEYAVVHDLTEHGYACVRAASSKGLVDVVAVKSGQVLFVNVKRTTMPGPIERLKLLMVTEGYPHLVPLVAVKPIRCPLRYVMLYGPGAGEWFPWEPDPLPEQPSHELASASARKRNGDNHENDCSHVADRAAERA
jgi:hypothetical protein